MSAISGLMEGAPENPTIHDVIESIRNEYTSIESWLDNWNMLDNDLVVTISDEKESEDIYL